MSSEDYILIDYLQLARQLADEEFKWRFEDRYAFKKLYYRVEDHYCLQPEYEVIYAGIEMRWRQALLEQDITQSI